jgi:TetR/AcrR family transcriptional regulator
MKQAFFQLLPEKKDSVLNAALNEFGAHDFAAASLDRIVAAAGISKGGLYEYITSKEDLYIFCMENAWSSLYQFIKEQVALASTPLPADVLERFMTVSRIAIEWYLQHPPMLGLIVRIARLPRDSLAAKAEAVFEKHFADVFAGLDSSRLAYPTEHVVGLIKWLLAKTRKDALLEIDAHRPLDEVRGKYLEEWAFFCSVLSRGIYRPD